MSNRGFYHNLDPNVSGLAKKVEVSRGQNTKGVAMGARRSKWRVVTALVVVALMAVPVIGSVAKRPIEDPGVSQATFGKTIDFNLYTHCGISELKAFDNYYARVGGVLGDGFGNPPVGWDNPYQAGRLSVLGDKATFRDTRGHTVEFKVRPGATGFATICS